MVRSADCAGALRLAQRILALSAHEGFPLIRAGVDVGPVLERGGDCWGSTINTAARIVEAALPGELLVTERVRCALAPPDRLETLETRLWRLKGVPGMQLLHLAALA